MKASTVSVEQFDHEMQKLVIPGEAWKPTHWMARAGSTRRT
jgi:hypothetical protein